MTARLRRSLIADANAHPRQSCRNQQAHSQQRLPTVKGFWTSIRRRRQCSSCGARFTTFERVQLRDLGVIKKDGRRVPFDRDKLARSIEIALRKRNVDPDRVEQTISNVVRELESLGENEVTTETIGETVMGHLRELDDVAYVRFASVYRNFREAKDFETALAELSGEEEEAAKAAAAANLVPVRK